MKNLSQVLNEAESSKTPEQMEHEHLETAKWFEDEIIRMMGFGAKEEHFHIEEYVDIPAVKKALEAHVFPDYFKKIVEDHVKENKNYYIWLKWMENTMKEYDTPDEYLQQIHVNHLESMRNQ